MARRKTLHLICQAHLDPVWLWPVQSGCAEALTTLQSAVDRAAEIPEFRFTRSSAEAYRWAKEMDPALWASIRQLIAEGRWEAIGSWIEQPDCNLPSTESFIRQGVMGGEFFARELNTSSRIGYNVDSFGHACGLPQILKKSGMDYYVFTRPMPVDNPEIPLLFWWESADGSRVLALRIPQGYSQSYGAKTSDIERYIRSATPANFPDGFDDGVFFLGVGNHGGGPTREHLAMVRDLQRDSSLPEIRFSTMAEYFAALEASSSMDDLPVIRGELQFHSRGCYSATSEVKRLHRTAEKALYLAEGLQAQCAADGLKCGDQPMELHRAWWKLLFNQFHDILAGTCIPQALDETRHRFGATLNTAHELAMKSTFSMARRVNTRDEKGSVLFVSNALPWNRQAIVQLDTFISPHGSEEISHLETEDGEMTPLQWMTPDSSFGPWLMPWGKLTAVVDLPAGGYRAFRVRTRELPERPGAISIEQFTLAQLEESAREDRPKTKTPALEYLSSKGARGVNLLREPVGFVVINDSSDTWGHDRSRFDDVAGRPELVSTELVESGPLLTVTRQIMRWQASELHLDVIRYAHTGQIALHLRVNWQESRQILKLEIATGLTDSETLARCAGEVARRDASGEEHPCQDWVALQGYYGEQRTTVAVLNDSSYSYSAEDGILRLIVARSAPYVEHRPAPLRAEQAVYMDQGWSEKRMWLVAAACECNALHLDRLAQEWQVPAQAVLDSGHAGTEPWEKSFFEVEPASVSVLALKGADDGDGAILRVQELSGKATEATVRWKDCRMTTWLMPWEIRSWRLSEILNQPVIEETSFQEGAAHFPDETTYSSRTEEGAAMGNETVLKPSIAARG